MTGRDRGSIAPLVPIVMLAFFLLGGLLVDGSRDLAARGDAQAYAEEAARAGATAVDPRSATLTLDTDLATRRVRDYCDAIRARNRTVRVLECRLDPDRPFTQATTCGGVTARIVVNTRVRLGIDTTLLDIAGIRSLSASGQAKARPFEGTNAGNAC